jgi:hypothetical protein
MAGSFWSRPARMSKLVSGRFSVSLYVFFSAMGDQYTQEAGGDKHG